MSRHLDMKQVAEELGVSVDQAKKLVTGGQLPAINVGSGRRTFFRVARADLDKWLADERAKVARRFGAA